MESFHDELAAANARIADLEREIGVLKAAKVSVPWSRPGGLTAFLLFVVACFLLTGLACVANLSRLRELDRSYRGVAVAPHEEIPPTVDPGNVAARNARPLDSANPYKSD